MEKEGTGGQHNSANDAIAGGLSKIAEKSKKILTQTANFLKNVVQLAKIIRVEIKKSGKRMMILFVAYLLLVSEIFFQLNLGPVMGRESWAVWHAMPFMIVSAIWTLMTELLWQSIIHGNPSLNKEKEEDKKPE